MRLLQTIPAKGSVPAKGPTEPGYIWPISVSELALNNLMTNNQSAVGLPTEKLPAR